MRQVNIKELRANLSKELQKLPFQVIKNRKIVGIMCTQSDYLETPLANSFSFKEKCVHNPMDKIGKELSEVIKKKKIVEPEETDIAMDETPTFGYPKSVQCRKKVK